MFILNMFPESREAGLRRDAGQAQHSCAQSSDEGPAEVCLEHTDMAAGLSFAGGVKAANRTIGVQDCSYVREQDALRTGSAETFALCLFPGLLHG